MKNEFAQDTLCREVWGWSLVAREKSWAFFFIGIKWEMAEPFNPHDPKQSLTFLRNGSTKKKEQGLEILLVSPDWAGSPI